MQLWWNVQLICTILFCWSFHWNFVKMIFIEHFKTFLNKFFCIICLFILKPQNKTKNNNFFNVICNMIACHFCWIMLNFDFDKITFLISLRMIIECLVLYVTKWLMWCMGLYNVIKREFDTMKFPTDMIWQNRIHVRTGLKPKRKCRYCG